MQSIDYDNHAEEWDRCLKDPDRRAVASTWLRDDTVDAWRHRRMREVLVPLIESDPASAWLTVGDGRYGSDAHFLLQHGVDCHASDMTSPLLAMANKQGFIRDYSIQNAESLDFPDGAFDYVYCKESYHHFPRPWIAVHEMFRVSRKAVILQEPADNSSFQTSSIARFLKKRVQTWLDGRRMAPEAGHDFEPVGNYVYKLSLQECEKFLLGMHHRWIAWCGLNDHYEQGVEFCPIRGGSQEEQALRRRVQDKISRQDEKSRRGSAPWSLWNVILFKTEPSTEMRENLASRGWFIKRLPENPYRER